jgi:hypothetical protein
MSASSVAAGEACVRGDSQWLPRARGRCACAESAGVVRRVLQGPQLVEGADVALLEYLQPELIAVLIRLLFTALRRPAVQLLAEIGQFYGAIVAVLDQIAEELAHCSPDRLRAILELLESMKAQPEFPTLFDEKVASALFAALPLGRARSLSCSPAQQHSAPSWASSSCRQSTRSPSYCSSTAAATRRSSRSPARCM